MLRYRYLVARFGQPLHRPLCQPLLSTVVPTIVPTIVSTFASTIVATIILRPTIVHINRCINHCIRQPLYLSLYRLLYQPFISHCTNHIYRWNFIHAFLEGTRKKKRKRPTLLPEVIVRNKSERWRSFLREFKATTFFVSIAIFTWFKDTPHALTWDPPSQKSEVSIFFSCTLVLLYNTWE